MSKMPKVIRENHKPIIETIINTAALAMTAFAVTEITTHGLLWQGYAALGVGMLLEFFKYYGRRIELW